MKGFGAKKNNVASDTEMKHGEEVSSCITYEAECQEYFGIKGCTGESGSDPVELWVMGPSCGLKVERGR